MHFRFGILAIAYCSAACRPRTDPGLPARSVQGATDPLRFASFPDGNVAVADMASCSVTRLSADAELWRVSIADCRDYLEVAVARDSVVFVRTAGKTVSLASDGRQLWSHPTPTVPHDLATPATTPGSLLVLAISSSSIAAFPHNGSQVWQFALPVGESLVASPAGSLGEGVVVLSERATYFLGGDGAVRGRHPHLAVQSP